MSLGARRETVLRRGQRLFDFGLGDPSEPTPAFIRQALIDAVPEASDYPTVEGSAELRAAAADYVARRFDTVLDPATEVLPNSGAKEAIFHLPMVLVDPSSARDVVVYAEPAYETFRVSTRFAGARDHVVSLTAADRYLFSPEGVGPDVLARTGMVFLNYPHNPSGQDLPAELFERWVEARDEHGFVLVSDECYCDLYFGEPPRSLLEFGRTGCIAVHSLSKRSGMTGYLSGFLAGDADIIAVLRRFRAGMGVASPTWTQAAATAAWSDHQHVVERRALFTEKRRILLEMFESAGIRVYPGNASLFLWVEVPAGDTDLTYADRLLEAGIVVGPGSLFGPDQGRFVRVALAPTVEECHAAAEAWPRQR